MTSAERQWKRKRISTRIKLRVYLVRKYGIRFLICTSRVAANKLTSEKTKKKYGSGYLSSKKRIKKSLTQRDGRRCQWCYERKKIKDLTIDHIIEKVDGGSNKKSNLRLLCKPCHEQRNLLTTASRLRQ